MISKRSLLLNSMETSSSIGESNHERIKRVVLAIEEYLKTKSEDTVLSINRQLQALSLTHDLSVFDPHTNYATEFFVSLYELLNKIEPRSHVAWYCVDVLTNVCRNPTARQALISTYYFVPPLSKLLSDQLTEEKKIRLLKLLQDLSCGIKISWQIPHLPHLMSCLTKWVESGIEEVITLSLGVLVNICYKNLPAVYTLSRYVDTKKFLRVCLPLQGPVIEVHTCKLLIILDCMKGAIPKPTLYKLVDATFKSVRQAFQSKDAILLRQIIEFFLDVRTQPKEAEILNTYDIYNKEVETLLEIVKANPLYDGSHGEPMSVDQDPECMALIFQFVHSLVEHKLLSIKDLYPRIIQLALRWIQTEIVSSQALAVLGTIASSVDENNKDILEPLLLGLPIFVLALNSNNQDNYPTHAEYNKRLGALLKLLRAMLHVDSCQPKILEELKQEMLLRIFVPLLGDLESPKMEVSDADTSSTEAANLYILTIALIHELAIHDASWINLENSLFKNKHIHLILAQALYSSPSEVKYLVFELIASPNFPKKCVTEAMGSMQSMLLTSTSSSRSEDKLVNDINFPILSIAQTERLEEVLDNLKSALLQKNLMSISTSEVMELYEYKLASMGHAERAAMASLEAASERCTHLQHRTAQLSAELNRLHQLHFHTQQCHEQAVKMKMELVEVNKNIENQLEAEKGRYKACQSQLKLKEGLLEECEMNLEQTSKKLSELTTVRKELDDKNSQLKQLVTKLEDSCTRLEKNVQKKDDHIKKTELALGHLREQVQSLETTIRKYETELQTKSSEIHAITKELAARKQIIDTITRVANSQFL